MFTLRHVALQVLLLIPLFTYANSTIKTEQDYVIVWDIGGVLAHVDQKSLILHDLGLKYMLLSAWHLMTPSRMRSLMFEVLTQYAGPQEPETPGKAPVDDDQGNPMPHFMADTWLCSRIPNTEILIQIDKAVDQWNPGYPVSPSMRALIKTTLTTALSAAILGRNTQAIPAALPFVQAFAQQGIPQYILSNFEAEAFEVVYNNPCNKELFSYFPRNVITTSGECHMVKPHHDIFRHFVEVHNLQDKKIIFIDDQPRNIEAAHACGWTTILLKPGNYAQLTQDLEFLKNPTRCTTACA